MPLNSNAVIGQIDAALAFWTELRTRSKYDDLSDLKEEVPEVVTILADIVERFAPLGSSYKNEAARFASVGLYERQRLLHGIVKALRRAYAQDYLRTVQEVVHADVFADFLEMAAYLLDEGYKDAAAVVAGSTLEEHLRNLCVKQGISCDDANGKPKKASLLNDELSKKSVYGKLEQKSVVAWLDLRNKAAHGDYGNYDKNQVTLFIGGIRDFVARLPA